MTALSKGLDEEFFWYEVSLYSEVFEKSKVEMMTSHLKLMTSLIS